MIRIKVPATTTNLGPGFDCLGVALDIYNIIEVEEKSEGLKICISEEQNYPVPLDENNLVFMAIKKVLDKVGYSYKGLKINLKSSIPLTRGLGSSAACIVGGLIAGNELVGRVLDKDEIIKMAIEMDGHPDNVLPALEGGMVIACIDEGITAHFRFNPPENIKFALLIPNFYLPTVKSRKIIPNSITIEDAVFNMSRVALVTAAFLTGNMDLVQIGVKDRIHQPYRKHLIPHWDEIINKATNLGARGVFLSGAGPTMVAIIDKDYQNFECEMQNILNEFNEKWTVKIANICKTGVEIL